MSSHMDLMQLCRLCLVKDGGNVPIFADDGSDRILKMTTCLPVQISRDDCLPKTICNGCSFRLELSYQFWNTTSNAEEELVMLSKQINIVKAGADAEEKVVTVFQIENEPLDIKEETVDAYKQAAMDAHTSETSLELKSEESFPKESESGHHLDALGFNVGLEFDAAEVSSFGCTALQKRGAPSISLQTEKRYKRRAAIKARKIINDITKDNEEENADDADMDEEFTLSTNEDGGSDDVIDDFDCDADTELKQKLACSEKTDFVQPLKVVQSTRELELKQNLAGHMNVRDGDESYKCNTCEYKCTTSAEVEIHMREHNGEMPYRCNICEYECSQKGKLKVHMYKHTGERPYKCNVCEYRCSNSSNLQKHMYRHTGEKPHKCNLCEYKCSLSSSLKLHMRSHTGERPYKCNVCEYKCSRSASLKEHLHKHTGEMPYKCDVCEYRCSNSGNLKIHVRIHTGERPYKCNVCEYKCSQPSSLRLHMRKHTGEKPYKCNDCEYKFAHPGNLKAHMRKHTDEKPSK